MKDFKTHSVWFLCAGFVAILAIAGCQAEEAATPVTPKAPANYIPGQPNPAQSNVGKANAGGTAPKGAPIPGNR